MLLLQLLLALGVLLLLLYVMLRPVLLSDGTLSCPTGLLTRCLQHTHTRMRHAVPTSCLLLFLVVTLVPLLLLLLC
jgi:hypothetical protein